MPSYLITGATGYVGSMLVKKIKSAAEASGEDCRISVIARDRKKASGMLPAGVGIFAADLEDGASLTIVDGKYDYVIHCAAITKSAEMANHPLKVTKSIVNATQNVMELAVRCKAESVVYVSSMEVYGAIDCSDGHLCEEDEAGKGFVDICNARSCYPLGKRMAENICHGYYKEYGLPVKIVRLAQTFGKGILPGENRVFAQFAKCALQGEDIVLHTTGNSVGNYCDIEDAVKGILTVLTLGADGEAYNIVNEACTMKICEMAQFVAREIAEDKISVRFEIPAENVYGYAAETGLRLSGRKLRSLGWQPQKSMRDMYLDVMEELKRQGL